ncbi:unnamed protein product [Aureobasidium pullulans]|nr:unnamed protein product [Aureobasidium pullulans]CAD0019978.1 unnamed protein product [Aureobasidium pullulans]CAD0031892.1 unnamed protein product [Aureobasidium pullulans]CAD0059024.1 unnamed protein product [Aureobasidium pullulans]
MADSHYGGYTRFELELEYFAEPKYIKYLSYPGPTIRALELLQQERFRKDILIPETVARMAEEGLQASADGLRRD